jgi:formate-nitrite transporter family protein
MDHSSKNPQALLSDPVTERDHAIGSPTAPITILEYGDYECPSCLNALPIIKEVRQTLGDRLRFVFRHFPQSSIHPHASAAAEAAEAAADQGKFWQMHEALFRQQSRLGEIDYSHLALTLGLEIYKFESSRTADKHRLRIRADYESGLRSGVKKTPTLFINGLRFDDPITTKAILTASSPAHH